MQFLQQRPELEIANGGTVHENSTRARTRPEREDGGVRGSTSLARTRGD